MFTGWSEKQDSLPSFRLAEIFSTSPLKPLNGIQRNLIGSKISTSSTKFVFLVPIRKRRWAFWPLICWDILDFSSEKAEQNSNETWQEARSPHPLPSLYFSGRSVNKNCRPSRFLKKVAHCTWMHDMWPFGPLVYIYLYFYAFALPSSSGKLGFKCLHLKTIGYHLWWNVIRLSRISHYMYILHDIRFI